MGRRTFCECEEIKKIVEKVKNKYDVPLWYRDNDGEFESAGCSYRFYW